MWATKAIVLLCMFGVSLCINKSVYKIFLSQKGFAQFLQYDVEIPPLREFTFCTWILISELKHDQSIFTYVVNGNNRVIQLWLSTQEPGERFLKVSIDEKISSKVPVNIEEGVWKHVCLSYQSDHGAWALYLDSRLVTCETARSLHGYVIPGSGSIIIGYGTTTDNNGSPNGLEGQVYGANMILASTIERNNTLKMFPEYGQRTFNKNKVRNTNNIEYVILKDLQLDSLNSDNNLHPSLNSDINFANVESAHNILPYDMAKTGSSKAKQIVDSSREKEILDLTPSKMRYNNNSKSSFWNIVNEAGNTGKFKINSRNINEQFGSSTHGLPTISEFETPPPSEQHTDGLYVENNFKTQKPPQPVTQVSNNDESMKTTAILNHKTEELSDSITPPSLPNDSKVYGQWTSSRFAASVLNYLKNINLRNKDKIVPSTIPLTKSADPYPYASEIKIKRIKPNAPIMRSNLIIEKRKYNPNTYMQNSLKRLHVHKRNAREPEINLKIVKQDVREDILKSHARTKPKQVEVTFRGETSNNSYQRFSRDVDSLGYGEMTEADKTEPGPFVSKSDDRDSKKIDKSIYHKSLLSVLPFLKSVEYFTEEYDSTENVKDIYTKSLANGNKWHNVKPYSHAFTPRRMYNGTEYFSHTNKNPSVRLKYKPDIDKLVPSYEDQNILKGRALAMEVSNLSDFNKDSVSILKYNHGYLPGHDGDKAMKEMNSLTSIVNNSNSFNKHVKLGNALNERKVIGINYEQKLKSFIGGNEKIPDINRYRSDIDNVSGSGEVEPSLKLRMCKSSEVNGRQLYVHPDESIDMTYILSPIRKRNIGTEFVMQNYKICTLDDSALERNAFLLLQWNKTPVRLFGGASARKTKDLCGFF